MNEIIFSTKCRQSPLVHLNKLCVLETSLWCKLWYIFFFCVSLKIREFSIFWWHTAKIRFQWHAIAFLHIDDHITQTGCKLIQQQQRRRRRKRWQHWPYQNSLDQYPNWYAQNFLFFYRSNVFVCFMTRYYRLKCIKNKNIKKKKYSPILRYR